MAEEKKTAAKASGTKPATGNAKTETGTEKRKVGRPRKTESESVAKTTVASKTAPKSSTSRAAVSKSVNSASNKGEKTANSSTQAKGDGTKITVEEVKVEPLMHIEAEVALNKEGNEKEQKPKKKYNYVNAKNSIFALSVVGMAMSLAYLASFLVTSIVVLATGGEFTVVGIIMQTASIIFFGILAALNWASVKTGFNYKKCNKYFAGELIIELVIAIISIIGYNSYFVLLAIVPLLIVSAVKLWVAQAIKENKK